MTPNTLSRRKFISTGTVGLSGIAAFGLPAFAQSAGFEKIQVGLIGSGSRGCGLISLLKEIPNIELAACCDVIPAHLEQGLAIAGKKAKGYKDYRELLDDKTINAVI